MIFIRVNKLSIQVIYMYICERVTVFSFDTIFTCEISFIFLHVKGYQIRLHVVNSCDITHFIIYSACWIYRLASIAFKIQDLSPLQSLRLSIRFI